MRCCHSIAPNYQLDEILILNILELKLQTNYLIMKTKIMKNLNSFLDEKLTEELGINCYKGIFKEVTRSFFKVVCETVNYDVAYKLRERLGLPRGVSPVYEEKEFFLNGYYPGADRYEWSLDEKLYCLKDLAAVDMKLIKSIPLIEPMPTNLSVEYNGLKKCLVVCNNKFVILADI